MSVPELDPEISIRRPKLALCIRMLSFCLRLNGRSEMIEVVCSEDQQESNSGDGNFSDGANEEGPHALLEEILQVGAQAHSGKGQQKCPATEVSQREQLCFVEAQRRNRMVRRRPERRE